MIKTISYLGLGTMGSGMAANLVKARRKNRAHIHRDLAFFDST